MNTIHFTNHNLPVPVDIIIEKRNSSRVSLGKKSVIIRLPIHINTIEKEKTIQRFLLWAKETIFEKKMYQNNLLTVNDYHNKTIQLFEKDFLIQILPIDSGKNRLNYRGNNVLYIYLQNLLTEEKKQAEIKRFLIRFTERYFLKNIQERVLYWNDLHFNETIQKIALRYTTSRWGSCSNSKKINLSTRLLLLPISIIDYVIVHELSHLKQMNHSAKFWNVVENAMPDYKQREKWLSKNGITFDF